MKKIEDHALIIFSGGQDSTTCLLWALKKFKKITAITFNYKQRHKIEIECAKKIINLLNSQEEFHFKWLKNNPNIKHIIINLPFFSDLLESAMIQDIEIKYDEIELFETPRPLI